MTDAPNCEKDYRDRDVLVGRQDSHDKHHQACGREDRTHDVEGARGIRRQRISNAAAENHNDSNDDGLKEKGHSPADRSGDETSDQWSGGCAHSTHPTDHTEGLSPRLEIVEQHGRKDVDGRYQQRRPHTLENRVPQDQDPKVRRDCAEQCADGIDREPQREAPFPAPTIGQLAPGNHESRHDQKEQRDRHLHSLDRGVQVVADVVDHDVHVRPGEAADELRQCQWNEHPPQ